MIIASTNDSSAGSRLTQGKKESQLSVSHQAAAGHRTTDVEMDLTVNGHGTKKDPQKEKENRILVKIITKEYEGYRKIIRIAKKHREVEKIKIEEEEEETPNPKQTIYIKYNKIQPEGRNEQSTHRNERRGKSSRNNSNRGTKNRHEGSSKQKSES